MFEATDRFFGRGRGDAVIPIAAALVAGATVTGLAWRMDSRRRGRQTAQIHRALVDLLLNALSAGDAVTERHSRRVADLTDALACTFRIPARRRATLRLAALLHDMGKIDDRFFHILHNPSPLSKADRAAINQHPGESADILKPLEAVHPGITEIVESHHECWDGSGYPRGLKGDAIPLESRIISVADVFDALTQPRAYRKPMAIEEALKELRRSAETRFDPEVAARVSLPRVSRKWKEIMERGRAEEHSGGNGLRPAPEGDVNDRRLTGDCRVPRRRFSE
jgi:response regulator RpfG family c-di-GMP phosphodiesterase